MQGTDHNKILGIIHLVYGILGVGLIALISVVFLVFIGISAASADGLLGAGILGVVLLVFLVINIVFSIPSFLAGYAMLKKKKWARTASIVAAVTDGMSFPFGTALCIYTLWFIFSDQGRMLYDNMRPAGALPPAPPQWVSAASKQREVEYVPPVTPPDWR